MHAAHTDRRTACQHKTQPALRPTAIPPACPGGTGAAREPPSRIFWLGYWPRPLQDDRPVGGSEGATLPGGSPGRWSGVRVRRSSFVLPWARPESSPKITPRSPGVNCIFHKSSPMRLLTCLTYLLLRWGATHGHTDTVARQSPLRSHFGSRQPAELVLTISSALSCGCSLPRPDGRRC